jgi:hypothetical protein
MAKGTLELLDTLSQRDLATALHELAVARVSRESAASEWALAAERRRSLEALLVAQVGAERERVDEGVARACDFVQAECFEAAAAERLDLVRAQEGRALARLQEAKSAERAAEASLANARVGERVIENRLARVAAVERAAREDANDEASQEAASARRRGSP